jgi:hypothetical protein
VRDVAAVDIRIETRRGGSAPRTLVDMAVEARGRANKEEAEIDEFWCVFDVEWPTNHPDLKEAVERAQANGIKLAVSNPCFELWLILHFRDHSKWLENSDARRIRRSLDDSCDKGLDAAKYMHRTGDAARRAAGLEKQHQRNGTSFPDDNPSSGMHHLLAAVEPRA